MQFQNPPIVELVVELKWKSAFSPPAPGAIPPGVPYPLPPNSANDQFLSVFQTLAAQYGWSQSERLIPPGFPYLVFQPAIRFRSADAARVQTIIQIGPGIFSAHALRPYKNWESFWPIAQEAISILLRSRSSADAAAPFFGAQVMYIDVFEEGVTGKLNVRQFMEDILGFELSLPSAITDQSPNEQQIDIQMSLNVPLREGLEMRLNIGGNPGWGDRKGIPMNTVVSSRHPVPPSQLSISTVFESAHLAIRNTFVGLTKKIHQQMIPIGDSK